MEQLEGFMKLVEQLKGDYERFYGKGVKKAAGEARKTLQAIRVKAKEMRDQVQTDKVKPKSE